MNRAVRLSTFLRPVLTSGITENGAGNGELEIKKTCRREVTY